MTAEPAQPSTGRPDVPPVGRPAGWWVALGSTVSTSVRDLNPGVFAFVMATGIVSTALRDNKPRYVSDVLLWIAVAGYVVLVVAAGWRLVRWRQRLVDDLFSPRGFAFLTAVAASNVLANRLALDGARWPAAVLLVLGVLGWLVLGYGVPVGLITSARRHPSLDQVNGTWFIWVVGTQSIPVAAAALEQIDRSAALAVFAAICWSIGFILYLMVAGLVVARLLVRPVTTKDLVPAYWVFMGAAAITVLAGARLLGLPDATRLLPHPLLAGMSMVLWSFCTWLVPLLVVLGVWRHVVSKVPLHYDSTLWSMVFPIGMYGVASRQLGLTTDAPWLAAFGAVEPWVALALWVATFAAMLARAVAVVHDTRANLHRHQRHWHLPGHRPRFG